MIICSCNVLSDHDVRGVVTGERIRPCSVGQVHHCLGCKVQCGRCMSSIRRIVNECATSCPRTCPALRVFDLPGDAPTPHAERMEMFEEAVNEG